MENTKDLLMDLVHEVEATLMTNEFGGLPHEVFLEWCIDELTEAGETEDLNLSNFDKRGESVHGYSFSDHDGRLDLYITSYKKSTEPYTIQKNELTSLTKRMLSFIQRSYEGKNDTISVHEPASDLIKLIKSDEVTLIRLFIFTDGKSNIARTEDGEILHFPTTTQIWDIERFLRLRSLGNYIEDTDITVPEYGEEFLPCSSTYTGDGDIKTYLCLMPGEFLADIYRDYTTRLLERNVRSVLSFKSGSTNNGMLRTIEDAPDKFIAYNNGLTATATEIEINKSGTQITKMSNFQIVNGGQTTNAIYRAKYSASLDLSGVFVQLKLCVLDEELINKFGPKISEFANTQNAIKKTDFSANNPVYRKIEKISRSMYAPATDGLQTETKWFFERARGQYANNLSLKTPAQKKKFEREYPRQQKIDKSQLAKYWGVWYQEVIDISLGPEKYHPIFIEDLDKNKNKFDSKKSQESFQKLVAMAILYKAAYSHIRREKYGYSFPGVTADYSIALISNLSGMRLDLLSLWKEQKAPDELIKNIDYIAPIIGKTIIDLVSKGHIPKELAKGRKIDGKTLWEHLLEKDLKLPAPFKNSRNTPEISTTNSSGSVPLTDAQKDAINKVMDCGSDELWALASWAKETNNLHPWQRGIIGSVAKLVGSEKKPSGKQAVSTIKALNEAEDLGFKYTGA